MTLQRIKAKSVKTALEQVQEEPRSLSGCSSDKKQGRKALPRLTGDFNLF